MTIAFSARRTYGKPGDCPPVYRQDSEFPTIDGAIDPANEPTPKPKNGTWKLSYKESVQLTDEHDSDVARVRLMVWNVTPDPFKNQGFVVSLAFAHELKSNDPHLRRCPGTPGDGGAHSKYWLAEVDGLLYDVLLA